MVLLGAHVEKHSVRLLVREASGAACVVARQLGVQELKMPSINASSFLRMGCAVFESGIVETPAATTDKLVLFALLK